MLGDLLGVDQPEADLYDVLDRTLSEPSNLTRMLGQRFFCVRREFARRDQMLS